MTRAWSGTFDVTQSWSGTFDVTQAWAGTFDVTQAWSGTVDVFVEAGFTGAYDDTPNIAAIYSMARRTLTSYIGNLVRLRRDSDNTEQDFGADDDGNLDTAAISTFLGANNGYVVTLYDQSGNGNDLTQATAAAQPAYVANGQNGRPTWRLDGSDDVLTRTVGPLDLVSANAGDIIVVQMQDGTSARNSTISGEWPDQSNRLNAHLSHDDVFYFDWGNINSGGRISTSQPAGWDDDWHIVELYRNGTTGQIVVDGTTILDDTFSDSLDSAADSTFYIGEVETGTAFFKGDIAEIVIADAAWSTAEREAAETAANDYWSAF